MTIEERNTARAIQDIAKELKKTPKMTGSKDAMR